MDEPERQEVLESAASQLYKSLLEAVTTANGAIELVIPMLQDSQCQPVWTGQGFVQPQLAAMESAVDFRPYLFRVPQALLVFRNLLVMLKVCTINQAIN